jgi:AraC-like DNA-binding protein
LNETAEFGYAATAMQAEAGTTRATARANIAGIGRVLLWAGGGLWIGRDAGRITAHAHHAIQLSFALEGSFLMKPAQAAEWTRYTAAIVRAHSRHQFDGCGSVIAQLFVEPQTAEGRALLALHAEGDIAPLPTDAVGDCIALLKKRFAGRAPDDALAAAGHACVARLAGMAPAAGPPLDPRIERVVRELRARLAQPVALADAAKWAHLSPSRFRHLFVAQTGSSFRAYLLWLRLNDAVGRAMAGATWTDAAHHAGFADSAHLSRTFRRMFGAMPVMLIKE